MTINRHTTAKLDRAEVAAMSCDGKTRFETHSLAAAVLKARNGGRNGKKNRSVYRCKVCYGFHLGCKS